MEHSPYFHLTDVVSEVSFRLNQCIGDAVADLCALLCNCPASGMVSLHALVNW